MDSLAYMSSIAQLPMKEATEMQRVREEMSIDSRTGYLK
jgi:hypothetical protein